MLRNRLYLGEIVHGKLTYPGQHAGIINSALFDEVQALLAMNKGQRTRRTAERAILTGLVHDAAGNRMTPAHSRGRGGKTYTYYVSQPLQQGGIAPEHILTRVPARQLEQALVERLRFWLAEPGASATDLLASVTKVVVQSESMHVHLADGLGKGENFGLRDRERFTYHGGTPVISTPLRCYLRGGKTALIHVSASAQRRRPDRALVSGLKRAHSELQQRGVDLTRRRTSLENARGLDDPYHRRLAALAFLAPDLQQAILEGRQPAGMTLSILLSSDLPLEWSAQRRLLGFGA
jgi:hypothetical protein